MTIRFKQHFCFKPHAGKIFFAAQLCKIFLLNSNKTKTKQNYCNPDEPTYYKRWFRTDKKTRKK